MSIMRHSQLSFRKVEAKIKRKNQPFKYAELYEKDEKG